MMLHRRAVLAGLGASGSAMMGHADAQSGVTVDRFGEGGRTILLLYGSDGLTNQGRYAFAARTIAAAGYSVLVPRYFEATGDRRARYSEIQSKFPIWRNAVEQVLGSLSGRVGLVGFSLGGALALAVAARSSRVGAVVDFFGFEPPGLASGRPLPPTLILHGEADRVVPVSHAIAIERRIKAQGGVVESRIYPGEGHGLSLNTLSDAVARTQAFLGRHLTS